MKSKILIREYKKAAMADDINEYDYLQGYSEDCSKYTLKKILAMEHMSESNFINLAAYHCAKGKQMDMGSQSYRQFKSDIKNNWLNTEIEKLSSGKNAEETRNKMIIISQLCGFMGVEECNEFLSKYARTTKLDPKNYADIVWIYLIGELVENGFPQDKRLPEIYEALFNTGKNYIEKEHRGKKNTQVLLMDASTKDFYTFLQENGGGFKNRQDDLKAFLNQYVEKYGLSIHKAMQLGDPCKTLSIDHDETERKRGQSKNGIGQYETYISKGEQIKRDKIIDIGLLMLMNLEELNLFLQSVNMDPLYPKDSFESAVIYYLSRELENQNFDSKKELSERLEKEQISIFDDIKCLESPVFYLKVKEYRYCTCENQTYLCIFDQEGYKYKVNITKENMDTYMFIKEGDEIKVEQLNRNPERVLLINDNCSFQ